MFIYCWNKNSEGATALIKALGGKKIRHENSKFKGSPNKVVINWGSSRVPDEVLKSKVLNPPDKIALCSNKLEFFKAVAGKGVTIPDWTTDPKEAMDWIAKGNKVCARTVLQGHSGEGLVIMDKDQMNFVEAPLYTLYIPKLHEYRVHVVRDTVIDVQRKALRKDYEGEYNFQIRNLANGFVFIRNEVNPHDNVLNEALKTIKTLGLDFGAVDIVWNQKRGQAFVLEVNTAPGLEGSSIENYANALRDIKE